MESSSMKSFFLKHDNAQETTLHLKNFENHVDTK